MTAPTHVPSAAYGVLDRCTADAELDQAVEQVRNLGYAVIDSGLAPAERAHLADEFERARQSYVDAHGEQRLKSLDEFHTVRAMLTHGGDAFMRLALNSNLIATVKKLIAGKFMLNQQNGLINPSGEKYSQGAWHRDLPYQHFVSSRPLAINALYCVDDFTCANGATFVLPASHKVESFPSAAYVQSNAVQVEAKAGSYIVLDCMVFHAGGVNGTRIDRRAVNHVFNIPYFKQQINLPRSLDGASLSAEALDILGFNYMEPGSVADFLETRVARQSTVAMA